MSVQKSFVVKNGLEVNSSLIFADATINSVGIATTIANYTLHVNGGIGATDLYVSGIATASAFYGDGTNLTFGGPVSLTSLVVSGVSTLGVTTATDLSLQNLYVSGIGTVNSGFITNFTGVAGTITTLDSTNGSVTNLTGTAATIGSVQISSGIVTASSGIVTYYGDGQYLQNILSGVGVATAGGTVGTGATILDFRGAGISTVTVASGIATINITGGGGGGGVPGGSDTEIQYNNAGSFDGVTGFVYNGTDLNFAGILTSTTLSSTNLNSTNLSGTIGTITTLNSTNVDITGVTTITNSSGTVTIGVGTTALLVEGNARITGILTVGTGSITLDGINDTINVGSGLTLSSSGINVVGIVTATTLDKTSLINYVETTFNLGNTGISTTINLENGNVFTATLTDNCTFTFTTGVTSGTASFTLILTNDATAGRSITWPITVKWPNNLIPPRTTDANKTDVWSFFTPDNGTTWYGNIALYNFT